MSLGSRSASRHLALLAGLVLGMVLGSSAVAAPTTADELQGMTGSNGRGMTGSNGRGMTGSNGRGMTGSNGRGMTGSNGRGMTGSNGRGMTGSNGRGMTGSNGRGMTGSNGRGMTGSNGRAYSAAGFGAGFNLAAMGTVEALSSANEVATIVVAGQRFKLSTDDAAALLVGDYVVVAAVTSESGAVVYPVGVTYQPGVSAVRVKGSIDSVDLSRGSLTVGGLSIDYTAHLAAGPMSAPVAGDLVEAVGVQPAAGGALLIDSSGDGVSVSASGRR